MSLEAWNGSAYGYPFWYIYINGGLIGWVDPSQYTNSMNTTATYIQAGGEVHDSWPHNRHTNTQMANGYQAPAGYAHAGYHRNLSWIDPFANFNDASPSYVYGTGVCGCQASSHYSLSTAPAPGPTNSGLWGTYFYIGG